MEPYREHQQQKRFYLGTNCHVLCIDQLSGKTLWQTKLESRLGSRLVSLLMHKGRIYAACYGYVTCLDAETGGEVWSAEAKRLGEPASLALDLGTPDGMVLAGGGGMMYAFSARSGDRLWKNGLPGLNYHPVTLRVPGALVAQPRTGYIPAGKAQLTAQLEEGQYEAEGFSDEDVEAGAAAGVDELDLDALLSEEKKVGDE